MTDTIDPREARPMSDASELVSNRYKLAPIKPTLAMIEAATDNCGPVGCCSIEPDHAREVWSAMLAASTPVGGWQDLATLPHPKDAGLFWAAIQVCSGPLPLKWEVHLIAMDDEMHDVHVNYYQGWNIDQYELWQPCIAPPPPPKPADGWIAHDGGPNPVPGREVEVKLREGLVVSKTSNLVYWPDLGDPDNVIAYRILPQTEKGS